MSDPLSQPGSGELRWDTGRTLTRAVGLDGRNLLGITDGKFWQEDRNMEDGGRPLSVQGPLRPLWEWAVSGDCYWASASLAASRNPNGCIFKRIQTGKGTQGPVYPTAQYCTSSFLILYSLYSHSILCLGLHWQSGGVGWEVAQVISLSWVWPYSISLALLHESGQYCMSLALLHKCWPRLYVVWLLWWVNLGNKMRDRHGWGKWPVSGSLPSELDVFFSLLSLSGESSSLDTSPGSQ